MTRRKDDIESMNDDAINDEMNRLEETYPTRMSGVSGLTERRKLFQFVARSRFDDYMEAFIDEQKKQC